MSSPRVYAPQGTFSGSRGIDVSMLASRHGGQCLRRLGSRLCLISNAAVLRCCCPRIVYETDGTGSLSADSAC